MPLDHELPVWTIRPNWSQSIVERLIWMTDVLRAESGHEQAISLRLEPRRSVEATFNATNRERTFLDLMLQRLGSSEWMAPLWFHAAELTVAAAIDAETISVDTVDREFLDGGMALLVGPDAFNCEAVRIDTVADGALTLVEPLARAWPVGTRVHPLRRSWVDASALQSLTSRVGEARIRFEIDTGNEFDGGAEEFPLHDGYAVATHMPNWTDRVETGLEWLSNQFDGKVGLRIVQDIAGRAFQSKRYTLLPHGRAENAEMRRMLYRLRGRAVPVWIPSHTDDLFVARPSAAAALLLDVQQTGLDYVGGITPDVANILIGGDTVAVIDSLGGALAANEERLVLTAGLARDVAVGETASFLSLSRLEGDTVSIEHLTDTDGASRVALTFRAFTAGRDGSAPGHYPIPEAAMRPGHCGDKTYILPPWTGRDDWNEVYMQCLSPNGRYALAVVRKISDDTQYFLTLDLRSGSLIGPHDATAFSEAINYDLDSNNVSPLISLTDTGDIYGVRDDGNQNKLIRCGGFGAGDIEDAAADLTTDFIGYCTWSFNTSAGDTLILIFNDAYPQSGFATEAAYIYDVAADTLTRVLPGASFKVGVPFIDAWDDIWIIGANQGQTHAYFWRVHSSGLRDDLDDLQIVTGLAAVPATFGVKPFGAAHLGGAGRYFLSWNSNAHIYLIDTDDFSVVADRAMQQTMQFSWTNVPTNRSDLWIPGADYPLLPTWNQAYGWDRISGTDLSTLDSVKFEDWGLAYNVQWFWSPTDYMLFSHDLQAFAGHWDGYDAAEADQYRPIIFYFSGCEE